MISRIFFSCVVFGFFLFLLGLEVFFGFAGSFFVEGRSSLGS